MSITIRIDATLKAKAQAKAKKEGRSLSNWIRSIIQKEVVE